jgi:alkylhydroperoxidase/carboxymuconolactone decarboxylase family protein YurZ
MGTDLRCEATLMITREQRTLLREVAIGDPHVLGRLLSDPGPAEGSLDPTVAALLRIASLIAAGADVLAYQREVNAAVGVGASSAQVIDVLSAVTPIIGSARAMTAAPRLALALGYDVDAALESLEVEDR